MLLNCNCAKLANFEKTLNMLRGPFIRGHSVVLFLVVERIYIVLLLAVIFSFQMLLYS